MSLSSPASVGTASDARYGSGHGSNHGEGRPRRRTASAADRTPVAYDFRRPIQLSRDHQRVLQGAFDEFARRATSTFTAALRTVCQVTLTSVEQRSYAEYIDSLDSMTYITKFSADPMPGLGLMELPLSAVMVSIDHMLGGPGTGDQPRRPLTDIETAVVSQLFTRLLDGLPEAMAELVAVDVVALGVEYSPQFAQAAGPNDVMVALNFEARINEQPHPITICLPFNGLLPHLSTAVAPAPVSARERIARATAAALLDRRLHDVPVDVAIGFRSTQVQPEAFAGLSVGDVLPLGHPAGAPLDVCVDGALFAHAMAGATATRLAARIVATPIQHPQETR